MFLLLFHILASLALVWIGFISNKHAYGPYKLIGEYIQKYVDRAEREYKEDAKEHKDYIHKQRERIQFLEKENDTLSGIFRAFKEKTLNEVTEEDLTTSKKTLSNFV